MILCFMIHIYYNTLSVNVEASRFMNRIPASLAVALATFQSRTQNE
jgi:hypothetical protein